jgi:hypothetical protein
MDNVFTVTLWIRIITVVVILVTFHLFRLFFENYFRSKMPVGKDRQELITEARNLKSGGMSYQDRIRHFQNKGLHKKSGGEYYCFS